MPESPRGVAGYHDDCLLTPWTNFLLICFLNCDVGARSNEGGVMRVISAMQLQTGRHLNTLSSEPQIWLYDATKYYCYCYFFLLLTKRHYSSNLLLASWWRVLPCWWVAQLDGIFTLDVWWLIEGLEMEKINISQKYITQVYTSLCILVAKGSIVSKLNIYFYFNMIIMTSLD